MKTWMKILMWLGVGGGIGFFAGYQVGHKAGAKEKVEELQVDEDKAFRAGYNKAYGEMPYEDGYHQALVDAGAIKYDKQPEPTVDYLNQYRGYDFDGDEVNLVEIKPEEEDADMPEEKPIIGDEEEIESVPQLHQQHFIPEQITDEEFYQNPWNYDQESMIFYEIDGVLFNKDTQVALTNKDDIDQAIGIGMTFEFYKNGETIDTLFVKNDTIGMLFRIDRIDAAYTDIVSGAGAPEYDEEEED